MTSRCLTRTVTAVSIVACLGSLVACQAPGFMGLNQDASLGPSRPDERLVRVRFRVLVPETLSGGTSIQSIPSPEATQGGWTTDERSIVGATVMIDGQKGASDVTDEQGLATLALPSDRVVPIRAEFNTVRGKVSLTTLAWASAEEERVPSILVSLPAALITARLATRHPARDLARLDRSRYLEAIRTLDARMRDETGHFDARWLPASRQGWGMTDLAAWLLRLQPVLDELSLDLVQSAPELNVSSSSIPLATASPRILPASVSSHSIQALPSLSPDEWSLADLGLQSETTREGTASLDGEKIEARFIRHVSNPTRRGASWLFRGTDTLITAEATRSWNFLVRVSSGRIRWANPGRPVQDLVWPPIATGSELVVDRGSNRRDIFRKGSGPEQLTIVDPRSQRGWTVVLDRADASPSVAATASSIPAQGASLAQPDR